MGMTLVPFYLVIQSGKSSIGSIIGMVALAYTSFYLGYHLLSVYRLVTGRGFLPLHMAFKYLIHILGIGAIAACYYIFFSRGFTGEIGQINYESMQVTYSISQPQEMYPVLEGVYGQEFYISKENLTFREATLTSDFSPYIDDFGPSKSEYLGYQVDQVALNALYYLPEGEGPFPLLLIQHGNHEMSDPSEGGYDYLGRYLASRGYLVVSIDANFLNYSLYDSILMVDKMEDENDGRAFLFLEHIRLLTSKNLDPTSHLFQKVDLDSIALLGHSRGGEAASLAAYMNHNTIKEDQINNRRPPAYEIGAVIAIAPTDGQYKPNGSYTKLKDINYLLVYGTHDMDVSYNAGGNQYKRIHLTDDQYFKSQILVYGASHGQFNSSWQRADSGRFADYLHNSQSLLPRDKQEFIGQILVYSFLEASLHDHEAYRQAFKSIKALEGLPANLYFSQYHQGQDLVLVDYTEDDWSDTTTLEGGKILTAYMSQVEEEHARLDDRRSQLDGVYLTTDSKEESLYILDFSDLDLDLSAYKEVYLSLADETQGAQTSYDFTIEIEDREGNHASQTLSYYGLLQHKLSIDITKFEWFDKNPDDETMIQTFIIPLDAFKPEGVDLSTFRRLILSFPKGQERRIFIKDIGIR